MSHKEGKLYYQVIHKRKVRQLRTGYKLYPSEWDVLRANIVIPPDIDDNRRSYLSLTETRIVSDIGHLKDIIFALEQANEPYTSAHIAEIFYASVNEGEMFTFARNLIARLREMGRITTADTYTSTINSFIRFRRGRYIPIKDINAQLMVDYETYLHTLGVCPNTISYYMRNLRAIYNRAVDKELALQRFPFRNVYTGIGRTVKRAVPLDVIRQIRNLDLSQNPVLDYARDIFMFSFYTRGMSFVDMAYLQKKDLNNGVLTYRRHKTNQQILIKWEKPMQEIVGKYDTGNSPYMLPIIRRNGLNERRQYRTALHRQNRQLKILGRKIGLAIPLTSYVARHAWASIAKSKNISMSVISEAMGHDSENTTRIYLASLDTAEIDKANSLILGAL